MKFSDDMRFPHPVLARDSGDFAEGSFDLELSCTEASDGKVFLTYSIELSEKSLLSMVEEGKASVGVFVRCGDTFYSGLHPLDWPRGSLEFLAGTLLNRVTVRPLIWLNEPLAGWKPSGVHEEFEGGVDLDSAAILAIAYEFVVNIGQANLAPLESIFALRCAPELDEGEIRVNLDDEKISILASTETYKMIGTLRYREMGKPAVLNSIYLPAVMEALDALRANPAAHDDRRWKQPFVSRCDALAVEPESGSLFENAQKLLERPVSRLDIIAKD